MQIENTEFKYISLIQPKKDELGIVYEDLPQDRYENKNNLPLNNWGEGPFCEFKIDPARSFSLLGVYILCDQNMKVLYIGKCTGRTSTLNKRFNQGYGKISPRNCFKGGQSTNCRINHYILEATKANNQVSLYFYETQSGAEATKLESKLINKLNLPWNINKPW